MQTHDLSGSWSVRIDRDRMGEAQGWQSSPWPDPPEGEKNPATVTVPGAWQTSLGVEEHGVVWHRRREPVAPAGPGQRLWLRFEAVATDCRVWVNGREVGRHVGDYLPFQFEVTEAARASRDGAMEITARIDEIKGDRPEVVGRDPWIGHITKGFHDVLSVQHGGIWDRVTLRRTGSAAIRPGGVWANAEAATGRVRIVIELEEGAGGGVAQVEIRQVSDGERVAAAETIVAPGAREVAMDVRVRNAQLWSPQSPALYEARVRMIDEGVDAADAEAASDEHTVRFGFRTIATGGEDNTRILLNGRPITIRGVLDWGVEPDRVAPAPPPQVVRERFAALRARGFNCICHCMYYPPEYVFDIADETGMLIWQEHPVWKSDMADAHVPEYKRLFEGFFRRDRNRASIVIVSATCEHERFNPTLAEYWWARASELLPHTLKQIQTGFMAWTDLSKTDLYDEHPYEPCGRWPAYLEHMQDELALLPPKPFVMGESILFTSWPDTDALLAAGAACDGPLARFDEDGAARPWWHPAGLAGFRRVEAALRERYGPGVVERLRRQADRHHLLGRKFEYERFRSYANHAGVVMNHIRDVSVCQCGFMDDLDRWRFGEEEFRSWWNAAPLLLETPGHRRAFIGAETAFTCRLGVSNFGEADVDGPVTVAFEAGSGRTGPSDPVPLDASAGDVAWSEVKLALSPVQRTTRCRVVATSPGLERNWWDLWALPAIPPTPAGLVVIDAEPHSADELAPIFEERKFSSGWGIEVKRWSPYAPEAGALLPESTRLDADAPIPEAVGAVLTHRLTPAVIDFIRRGGRAVLLAARGGAGQPPTAFATFYGQIPMVLERLILEAGDSEWMIDLFAYDLTRRCTRFIDTSALGIADDVDPIVRLLNTHDQKAPRMADMLFAARVGQRGGAIMVSALDHTDAAGRYLLGRMLGWAASEGGLPDRSLDPAVLESWLHRPETSPAPAG
jgi:hypothetical protein